MRLRDLKKLIGENVKSLTFDNEQRGADFVVSDFHDAIEAILNMKNISFLRKDIMNIQSIEDIFYNRNERVIVNNSMFSAFTHALDTIRLKCHVALDMLSDVLPEQDEFSASIKLPNYTTLAELAEFFSKIDKIFNQTFTHENIETIPKLQNFDSGSFWVEIVVGTTALTFLVSMTWAAAVVRKKLLEGDLLEQQVRSYELKNDAMEALKDGFKKSLDTVVEVETRNLLNNSNIDYDNEYLERAKYSVKALGELLYQGAEIHTAIDAPEAVQNLLPDYSKLDLISSTVKQLISSEDK